MAQVLSDYVTTLQSWLEPRVSPQMNRSVPLLQVMKTTEGRGPNVTWDITTGTDLGIAYSDGATMSTYTTDTKTKATLAWAQYAVGFAISGRTIDAAASAGLPTDFVNLFAFELKTALERLSARLGIAILTGDISASAPEQIGGLIHTTYGALKATGNSYGGIDKAAITQFQGNELLNGGTTRDLSLGLMRDTMTEVYKSSGFEPDMIVCSPAMQATYGKLMKDQRRVMQSVNLRGQQIVLDGGYTALEFDGIPVFKDRNVPDATMLFLRSDGIELKNLPSVINMPGYAPDLTLRLRAMPESQLMAGEAPLTCKIIAFGRDGDAVKYGAFVTLQQKVARPNEHAMLGDLRVA
jgi:hypothetical protein